MGDRHPQIAMDEIYFFEQHQVAIEETNWLGRVLDIGGGGEGIIGRIVGERVVAIDHHRRELEEAPPGPIKIVMDARDLDFLDETFGTVTAFFSLMYIRGSDHSQVFAEAFRTIVPGGRFLIWDLVLPQCLDETKRIAAIPLKVKLPAGEVETTYGARWPDWNQDLVYYALLAEQTGFEIVERRDDGRTLFLDLKKPIAAELEPLAFEPELVKVDGAPFIMGTSDAHVYWLADSLELAAVWREKGFFEQEQPQHVVASPAYAIGRYPVTVGQYRVFVESNGYTCRAYWTEAGWAWRERRQRLQPDYWDDATWTGRAALPVVGVSWYEAHAYCRWLSDLSGRPYRLPTEAEWEKAARGVDGRIFPWGDVLDPSMCNARPSGVVRTAPVGGYSPEGDSPFGCADMAGNVSEWTASLPAAYPYDANDRRNDPETPGERITRGGSWRSPILRVRATVRGMNAPSYTDHDLGFRCARDL